MTLELVHALLDCIPQAPSADMYHFLALLTEVAQVGLARIIVFFI